MFAAVLLIKILPKKEIEVHNELLKIPGVVCSEIMFGDYDFVARVVAENLEALKEVVTEKIERIPGIVDMKVNLYPIGKGTRIV
jgi:DNA-binding Lrp family transcriptional regulator